MTDTDELRSILSRHCTALPDEIDSAAGAFAEAVLRRDAYDALTCKVIEIVHRINGSSGTLGFGRLSAAARQFEDALIESRATGTKPDEGQVQALCGLLDELKVIAGRTAPEDSSLFQLDISALKRSDQA